MICGKRSLTTLLLLCKSCHWNFGYFPLKILFPWTIFFEKFGPPLKSCYYHTFWGSAIKPSQTIDPCLHNKMLSDTSYSRFLSRVGSICLPLQQLTIIMQGSLLTSGLFRLILLSYNILTLKCPQIQFQSMNFLRGMLQHNHVMHADCVLLKEKL